MLPVLRQTKSFSSMILRGVVLIQERVGPGQVDMRLEDVIALRHRVEAGQRLVQMRHRLLELPMALQGVPDEAVDARYGRGVVASLVEAERTLIRCHRLFRPVEVGERKAKIDL